MAKAVSELISGPLSSLMVPVLAAASPPRAETPTESETLLLQVLLALYSAALKAHALCAALQPQIMPLPGQVMV